LKAINSTINSVKWNAINSGVSQITTIITGVVLMRILDASAFGLIGMITVFTGFLNILKDSGLASSLIYQGRLSTSDKDTVFWFNIGIGFLLTLVFFFSSSFIAAYYEEPMLDKLVKVFSSTFIISAFSITQYTLLKKELAFKKIFQVEIIGIVFSAIFTIIAVYMGFGVWSLIVLHVSRALMISINTWLVSEYKPTIKYSYSVLKKHFQYSLPVLGTKSFNYWTRNADNFFIGSFLGSQALGYYSRAFFFVNMPTQKISSIIGNILFPSLSMLKEDKAKAVDLYLKSIIVIM
jgi:PST family polysaccharide transporter